MINVCKKCGFILGTRPGLKDKDGICYPCINSNKKKEINFYERQVWLTQYIKNNKTSTEYDCVVAVSGGKDSHAIVASLIEYHGVTKPLLVTICDEFTPTKAGEHNRKNIAEVFDCDHLVFRQNPNEFIKNTKKDFEENLHPLKWIEEMLYQTPINIAKKFGIKLVFFGENSAFEYGGAKTLDVFHPASDEKTSIIFFGAVYPYSNHESLEIARKYGFKDLKDFEEWPRSGSIDSFAQIDSIGYMTHHWCKFPKFGFQRVSDMASRFVREGKLTKEQALLHIKERDHILDEASKADFCRTLRITESYFDEIVDRHANLNLVVKDINGNYRRKDLV